MRLLQISRAQFRTQLHAITSREATLMYDLYISSELQPGWLFQITVPTVELAAPLWPDFCIDGGLPFTDLRGKATN